MVANTHLMAKALRRIPFRGLSATSREKYESLKASILGKIWLVPAYSQGKEHLSMSRIFFCNHIALFYSCAILYHGSQVPSGWMMSFFLFFFFTDYCGSSWLLSQQFHQSRNLVIQF
jgi:hypothetical protein